MSYEKKENGGTKSKGSPTIMISSDAIGDALTEALGRETGT